MTREPERRPFGNAGAAATAAVYRSAELLVIEEMLKAFVNRYPVGKTPLQRLGIIA